MTSDTAGESEDGFTFNDVLTMFIIDILIFSALAWYTGNVRGNDDIPNEMACVVMTRALRAECLHTPPPRLALLSPLLPFSPLVRALAVAVFVDGHPSTER